MPRLCCSIFVFRAAARVLPRAVDYRERDVLAADTVIYTKEAARSGRHCSECMLVADVLPCCLETRIYLELTHPHPVTPSAYIKTGHSRL